MVRKQSPDVPARRRAIAFWAVASSVAMSLPGAPGFAQTGQGATAAAPATPPLDTHTASCDALKDRLQRAGTLYVTGPQGWSETFYSAPQCEFWLKPVFHYVRASDGACGLGYLCEWKPGGAR